MKRYKPRGRAGKRPSKEEFDFLYYNLNLTAQELAERYQVKVPTIYNWATTYRKLDD